MNRENGAVMSEKKKAALPTSATFWSFFNGETAKNGYRKASASVFYIRKLLLGLYPVRRKKGVDFLELYDIIN